MALQSIVIIGGGRVGLSLGLLAKRAGYEISAVLTRREKERCLAYFPESLCEVADFSGSTFVLSESLKSCLTSASMVLFATPDSVLELAIKSISTQLSAIPIRDSDAVPRIALHVAGAQPEQLLSPLAAEHGFQTGVLHPCYPFFEVIRSFPSNTTFTFSGAHSALLFCQKLCAANSISLINLPNCSVSAESRVSYHAGNVLCAGHVATLLLAAEQVFLSLGLTTQEARQIILSMLSGELQMVATAPALVTGLTGPFVRQDAAVIERQIASFEARSTQLASAYKAVGELTKLLISFPKGS